MALLTGGGDRPYVLGLAPALMNQGVVLDLIGSDYLDAPEFHGNPQVNFFNLRGDQGQRASALKKVLRVLSYYVRLIRYAATAKPKVFHILWNNKLQALDRTLLMFYYKLLGKRIALTAHNVNAGVRDSGDTRINRLTLRIQYRLCDHLFVHTEKMKKDLVEGFGVSPERVTVIPFGVNSALPNTGLTPAGARQRLALKAGEKAILFFGNIAPYKGLEYLVEAFQRHLSRNGEYRLIIAGIPKNCATYWAGIQQGIREDVRKGRIILRAEFIPDAEAEVYFKAADVVVLPYRYIYQSGVLFTGFNYGLPALVADVGSLREEIIEGETGWVFRPEDPADLARAIEKYFASELFANLTARRPGIRDGAIASHSWDRVAQITQNAYAGVLSKSARGKVSNPQASGGSVSV